MAATKCNSLVEWDVVNGKPHTIPIPVGRARPGDSCGMHALAMNSSQTLLCVGGTNPCDGLLMDRNTYRPLLRLEGHHDWIFGMCFLKNDVLATCSRDATVALWNLGGLPAVLDAPTVRAPSVIRAEHRLKVRDLRLMPCYDQLATLSAGRIFAHHFDTHSYRRHREGVGHSKSGLRNEHRFGGRYRARLYGTWRLYQACLMLSQAFDENRRLLAVGSQFHVVFVDPRSARMVACISSPEGWGVRSLSFKHNLLTVGGSGGTLRFFDTRTKAAVTVDGDKTMMRVGRGWVRKDANFHAQQSRLGEPPANAVYTHAWDEGGTRLFVAGGPLLVGLRGSYAAMWT